MEESHSSNEELRPKKIGSAVNLFKQGIFNNLTVVCTLSSPSNVKIFEPVGLGMSNLHGKIGKLFKATNETLHMTKVFCFLR
jgi:hypothetical protein